MTKLVKKSVDVNKVMSHPHQSWAERLMTWGLSKPSIASIFLAITGWVGLSFAEEKDNYDAWTFAGKVTETFQNSRKIAFIVLFCLIIICIILALFKKISKYWLFSLFMSLISIIVFALLCDYLTEPLYDIKTVITSEGDLTTKQVENKDFLETLFITISGIVGFIVYSLPALITLIRYKLQKIDKKLMKHRLRIWFITGLFAFVVVIGLSLL